MADISIEWLSDTHECDTCGYSYAEGAKVFVDGLPALEMTPSAHCFDGDNYDQQTVFKALLEHLGHSVEFS